MIERFRKRPLEVEMMLWDGTPERGHQISDWVDSYRTDRDPLGSLFLFDTAYAQVWNREERQWLSVPVGHRVAKGKLNEFYPVSPAAIAETFDPAPQPLRLSEVEAVALMTDFHFSMCDDREQCQDCTHKVKEYRAVLAAVTPYLEAEALRAYADRHHGQAEGMSLPVDYGTGVEYIAVCQCGSSCGEDGCPERTQLIADAANHVPAAAGEPEAVTQQ